MSSASILLVKTAVRGYHVYQVVCYMFISLQETGMTGRCCSWTSTKGDMLLLCQARRKNQRKSKWRQKIKHSSWWHGNTV